MTKFQRIIGAVTLGLAMMASNAFATTITQTFTTSSLPTEVTTGGNQSFNFFQSAGAPSGSTLNSVALQVSITENLNSLSLTNSVSPSQTIAYLQTVSFQVTSSGISTTDRNNLRAGTGTGGTGSTANTQRVIYSLGDPTATDVFLTGDFQTVAGNTTLFLVGPGSVSAGVTGDLIGERGGTGTVTWFSGIVAGTTANYNATGTFTLGFNTVNSQTMNGGGGNVTAAPSTSASATYTITYDYTAPVVSGVPEPMSMSLFGGGLIGIALLRKRFARQ